MPYIAQDKRGRFCWPINEMHNAVPENCGELNYLITTLCKQYVYQAGVPESYQRHNDVIGVLEAAKLEWYRRRTAPYEDKKIEQNGDV